MKRIFALYHSGDCHLNQRKGNKAKHLQEDWELVLECSARTIVTVTNSRYHSEHPVSREDIELIVVHIFEVLISKLPGLVSFFIAYEVAPAQIYPDYAKIVK